MNHDLTSDNPLSQDFTMTQLLRFVLPTIIMMICMGLYTLGDTVFVAQFVNTNALSALNIVCPVINLIVGLGTMIATGGSALIAKKMGQQQFVRANQDFTLLFFTTLFLGIVIAVIGSLFIDEIIIALGASPLLQNDCKDYLQIIFIFTPACMLQVYFQSFMITAGRPTFGLVLSLSAGAINVVFDYLLMSYFQMGIMGSAIGTSIGYMIPTVIGILFFSTHYGTLKWAKPIYDNQVIIKSCSNGISEMVSQVATAITTFFFNMTMMRLIGEKGVAAMTIMIYTQFLLTTLYIGFSMGVAPIISYHHGAHHQLIFQKLMKKCLLMMSISSLFIFLLTQFYSSFFIQLFVPLDNYIYQFTQNGFHIFTYSFLFVGFNIFSSAMFTALSNGKISAIISFLRTFVFLMLGLLILPTYLHVTGVWLTIPLAEGFTFLIVIILIIQQNKSYHFYHLSSR